MLWIFIFVLLCVNETAATGIYTYRHTLSLHAALPIVASNRADESSIAVGFTRAITAPPWLEGLGDSMRAQHRSAAALRQGSHSRVRPCGCPQAGRRHRRTASLAGRASRTPALRTRMDRAANCQVAGDSRAGSHGSPRSEERRGGKEGVS